MILFFGTRPGKAIQRQLSNVSCPHCQQTNTLEMVEQDIYFHLFWIKLFKIQINRFVECSHCKKVFYEHEFSNGMRYKI